MGFWDDMKDALKDGALEVLALKEAERLLELSAPVARRDLKRTASSWDEASMRRLIGAFDRVAAAEPGARADQAAALAEYAESLI